MEATVISRALRSNTTTCQTSDHTATAVAVVKSKLGAIDHSVFLFRIALASLGLTLILFPGGLRALHQNGMGWEAWSFARFLILAFAALHLLCCWIPLSLRYFKPGECRDIPAFYVATAALFIQTIVAYALFSYHSLWHGGAA